MHQLLRQPLTKFDEAENVAKDEEKYYMLWVYVTEGVITASGFFVSASLPMRQDPTHLHKGQDER